MRKLTQAIKTEAKNLGFSLVGVTTPDPPPHLDFYRAWLKAGHHAKMGWMATERARHRRANPRAILPECESILVLALPYPPPPPPQGSGKVSSYAWNRDYHDIIPPKLKKLVQFIEKQTGESVPNRWYTDTGPLLERELASRAGLGWIGKNTCLINPRRGSYFFLAEILLGIRLVPDQPFSTPRCGDCTRCLDACPTGSLRAPHTLDANGCIAYLTIELKEAIPSELRPLLGDWVFGCDICQQVCPWNERFAGDDEVPAELAFRAEVANPILEEELALSPQDFNRKFKGSPLKRSKRRGYLRNVAVALGNVGKEGAVSALVTALGDGEPLVRGHAAWGLGRIRSGDALQALEAALRKEETAEVREEIQAALDSILGETDS
ncbi:MAG: Epoxyqueuosine reductase [Chloroflexi bacterium]|nr:Epoxyqueuosine reductase [Chloroflexota bacterium]